MSLLLSLAAITTHACSIPVFRYALDRWPADAYRLEVPAGSVSDPAISQLLRNLGDDSPVNLKMVAPASSATAESRLFFPADQSVVWSGNLNRTMFTELTNSPARAEIGRRLLSGESAVWVMIDSGNQALDDSEAARLEKRLAFLETAATLPRIDPTDPSNRLGPGPELRVKFSSLRLAHGNDRESILQTMLLGPKQDWPTKNREPIAAVVFGRGRVLGAWPMKDLGDESIDEACLYLLGACSCQVKQLNPGWDLLLSVAWDEALQSIGARAVSEATSEKPGVTPAEAESVTIQPQPTPDSEQFQTVRRSTGITIALAVAATLLAFAGLWRLFR